MVDAGWSQAWHEYMLHLRGVLRDLGVDVAPCGPDESEDCGRDYVHHCVSYMAAIRARAEFGLRHLTHGDPAGEWLARQQYDTWRDRFAAEDAEDDCGQR